MYTFNQNEVFETIKYDWTRFMANAEANKCIIGISGGIDSTCVAALACKIFGKENVIGISLPCEGQKDMSDVDKVFEHLNIKRLDFDIGDAFYEILDGLSNNALDIHPDTRTNLPARLRMTSLYAFSQSIPGSMVINTCNLSESLANYDTLFGDNCGSYAPIQELTKSEVRILARWLDVPEELVMKTPIDGLQDSSDEERFGFTYAQLDTYIRNGAGVLTKETIDKILKRYYAGQFKLEMVNIKHPTFEFPDHIRNKNVE